MRRLLTAVLILACTFTEAATLRHPELDSGSQIPGQARDDVQVARDDERSARDDERSTATLRHPELVSGSQIPGQARDDVQVARDDERIARDDEGTATAAKPREREKVFQGCDGGMMIHSGYLGGSIPQTGFDAAGGVIGLGGVARAHLWKHWRIGGEGYVTTEPLNFNDSYIRWGWGGLLVDWYHNLGRFMPYVGITIGGGAKTDCLIFENGAGQGDPIRNGYYRKQGFFAVDPNIGCDYILKKAVHLTLKLDCLCCISDAQLLQPTGPRIYFGVIFYH